MLQEVAVEVLKASIKEGGIGGSLVLLYILFPVLISILLVALIVWMHLTNLKRQKEQVEALGRHHKQNLKQNEKHHKEYLGLVTNYYQAIGQNSKSITVLSQTIKDLSKDLKQQMKQNDSLIKDVSKTLGHFKSLIIDSLLIKK